MTKQRPQLPGQLKGKGYRQSAEYYGFPAYAIDKLAESGLFGRTRKSVIEQITSGWMVNNLPMLEKLGITMDYARDEGYVPVKFKNK